MTRGHSQEHLKKRHHTQTEAVQEKRRATFARNKLELGRCESIRSRTGKQCDHAAGYELLDGSRVCGIHRGTREWRRRLT